METTQENQQETPGGKFKKESLKFENNLKKLGALMQGHIEPARKASNDIIGSITGELLEERNKKFKEDFKKELTELIDKKIGLDKEIKAKENELMQIKTEKYKQFNQAINTLFGKIEDINGIESAYNTTLAGLGNAGSAEEAVTA